MFISGQTWKSFSLDENMQETNHVYVPVAQAYLVRHVCELWNPVGMCSGSIDDYNSAVADNQKRMNVIYKQKPAKINTLYCNAAILKLLRANMNI